MLFSVGNWCTWLILAGDHLRVVSPSDAESGGCVRGIVTNSRPSAWPLPRSRTTQLYGDRRRQGPGRRGTRSKTRYDDRSPLLPSRELFSLEEEPGGGLPAPLSEVAGRQDKVVRHVLEDLGSVCPVVQILDLPMPHMMDQLAELLNLEEDVLDAGRLLDRDFQVPELVIEVPKISLDVIPLRTLVSEPQLSEQLVEVPTIVSFSSFQRIMEQTVDIPGGGLHRPGQSSSSADEAGEGFFRTFPQIKKSAKGASHSRSALLPESSPSTPAAQQEAPSSGCGSGNAMLARLSSGTDVLTVQSGGLQLVSMSCGSAKGMRRERCTTGMGTRVPPHFTSLLFLLSEELHRQPRAVYKYWAGGCSAS